MTLELVIVTLNSVFLLAHEKTLPLMSEPYYFQTGFQVSLGMNRGLVPRFLEVLKPMDVQVPHLK